MTDIDRFQEALTQGLTAMAIELSSDQIQSLLNYHQLLMKWNKAYNLTAVRDPNEMIERHLLDSLSVLKYFKDESPILDVGTGAGLPGIPLAIALPETQVTLLDCNSKKTRFLVQVVAELSLKNVQVTHERVERLSPITPFKVITSRAFASLEDMVNGCEHLLAKEGRFLAMKGRVPEEELAALPEHIHCLSTYPLFVPGCDGERHLIELKSDRL